MTAARPQAVIGVVAPQTGEAIIRVSWPSVAAFPAVAHLGKRLILSIAGAPLGWLLMAPIYFMKILPIVGRRYTLTNKALKIQKGWKRLTQQEVSLADIEDVRAITDANSAFFRSGKLEIVSKGQVVMTLPGVSGPESFRHAIVNAAKAWGPLLNAKA